jgi:GT2 family glycosyltransferase
MSEDNSPSVFGDTPALSVVLVVGDLRSRAEECLRSILQQVSADRVEVLLFNLAKSPAAAVAGSDHPSVRVIELPPGTPFASARAEGVRRARAPFVAFLEEHCRVKAGWIDALLAAHAGPWAGVGGEVHNGNPETPMSETIALMTYASWQPPACRDEDAAHLPGHNASFRRDRLLELGEELELLLVSDINLHRRLRTAGERLLLDPAVKFEHINPTGLGSVARGYFLWHRLYGWSRARVFRWPARRRFLYVALTPVIPLYFLLRLHREIRRLRPDLLDRFRHGLLLMWAMQMFCAVGQGVGLLFGPGDALKGFTRYELNEPRPVVSRLQETSP